MSIPFVDPLFRTAIASRTYLSAMVGIYAWDVLTLLKAERALVWRVRQSLQSIRTVLIALLFSEQTVEFAQLPLSRQVRLL